MARRRAQLEVRAHGAVSERYPRGIHRAVDSRTAVIPGRGHEAKMRASRLVAAVVIIVVGLLALTALPRRWLGQSPQTTRVPGADAAVAKAEGSFLVGFSEDALKYRNDRTAAAGRVIGARGFRVTLGWEPGQTTVGADDARDLERATTHDELRVVLSIYAASGAAAPLTPDARDAYCAYARDALVRFPHINDVVIWNEPNKSHFWRPQFDANGESAAPAAYVALLARCWDVLHALRPNVNVIGFATSSRGNDRPDAASNVSHSPGAFIRAVGAAYRMSGRREAIFDTVAHHAYGETSAE